MKDEDWLKSIEKKLEIAQCIDREKVLFTVHQLFGTTADWWETYRNSHQNDGVITWNEFKARFMSHPVFRLELNAFLYVCQDQVSRIKRQIVE
jgi:hypothetical protein